MGSAAAKTAVRRMAAESDRSGHCKALTNYAVSKSAKKPARLLPAVAWARCQHDALQGILCQAGEVSSLTSCWYGASNFRGTVVPSMSRP